MLVIRKKSNKNFVHETDSSNFSYSKVLAKAEGDNFLLIEKSKGSVGSWSYTDVSVYDDTDSGTEETFVSSITLLQRLYDLGYPILKVKDI